MLFIDTSVLQVSYFLGSFDGPPIYMMLLSAIYFKSSWQNVFLTDCTQLLPFHINNKETIDVPTMNRCTYFQYKEVTDFNAVIVSMSYKV